MEKGTKFAPAGPYYCVGFYTMLAALSFYADPFCFFAASNFFITVARFLINVSCSINLFICFVYSGNYHQGLRNIFNGAIREFRGNQLTH